MPVHLNFALTFNDYLNAQRLHARINWWRCLNYFAARFVLPVIGILLMLQALLMFLSRTPGMFIVFMLGFGGFLALYPLYYRSRLQSCYRRTRIGNGEKSVELDEEEICINEGNATSKLKWMAVKSLQEDKNVFLLYLAPAKFIILPKHSLTPEQTDELRALLTKQAHPPS